MAEENKNMLHLVDDVRNQLRFKKLLFCLFALFAGFGLTLLILGKLATGFALRDDQQFALFLFVCLPAVILLFKYFKDFKTRKLSRQDIALKVETLTPELMDSYVCALEIAEKGGPQGRIEEALTHSLANRFKSGEIQELVTPGYLKPAAFGCVIVLAFISVFALLGNPLLFAVRGYVEYQRTGEYSGFVVTPGHVRLAKGSDLEVSVELDAGPLAAELEYVVAGKWTTLEMIPEGDKKLSAIIYGIEENLEYRVITEKYKSKKFEAVVFMKPAFEKIEFKVEPPAYTGKPAFVVNDLKSFAVPQKSKVSLSLEANKDVNFAVVADAVEIPVNSEFKLSHKYELDSSKTAEYQLKIVDSDGHETVSDKIKLSVVRDMPPHIEVVKPAKDLQKTKFDIVTLEVSALDDYGLTAVDLHIDYSFGSSEVNEVFSSQPDHSSKEENLFYDLDLKKLGLSEGDVITYYLEAKDNAEPNAQVSRTKIFFLEIRPDKNDVEDKEDEEQQGDEQELSVNDLIASQKDLIRSLIDVKNRSQKINNVVFKVDPASIQELSSETATLRLAVQKRMDELKAEAEKMGASLGIIGDLFASSLQQLKTAEQVTGKSQLQNALKANNKSLSDLIKIAIELEKNSQKSQSQSQPQEKQEQQQQEQQEDETERLADMLKKLEDLEDQQKEIEDQLKDMKEDDLQEQQAMQEKMQEQQERLEDMSESLEQQQQQQASENLQQAAQQMQQGQQQMQQGNQQGAQQQTQQAQQQIQNAKNDIKRAMREQARKQLKQLADVLDQTVEKQQELSDKTAAVENPASAEGKKEMAELKKSQDQIQDVMQKLTDQLGVAANELDEKYPEVPEALRESREYASNQGIDRRLKRSSNALHYRRKASAQREQEKVVESMTMLGHKVRDAVNRLPQATLEELLQMRQEVETVRRQVGATSTSASSAFMQQRSEQIQKMMEEMGQVLQNSKMEFEIPQNLEVTKEEGVGLSQAVQGQMSALNQAAFILDSMISKADLEKRLTLNKRTGKAPDKYKRSVREYLKSLSDGQE
ncbi:MAG: DUF4175 family protein [Lentisphaerales bacterium]|nr:DUF4175 family protein [Lentisphaerales bacterium]